MSISSTVTLRGGVEVPQYVFGTGGIFEPGPLHAAYDEGYRAFDTAQMYGNEREVGAALRDRSDVFIISKVKEAGTIDEVYQGIKDSVDKLGHIDLMLVHNPNHGYGGRKSQWLALERAKQEGLVRAIGVSNFHVHHMEGMKEYAKEVPVVNQTELSCFNQNRHVHEYCNKEGIRLQAFAPVARAQKRDDPDLTAIAKEIGQPWNRVMLRYAFQKGWMVTCKSDKPERIHDNTQIFSFELSPSQMARLDALECGYKVTPSNIPAAEREWFYLDKP